MRRTSTRRDRYGDRSRLLVVVFLVVAIGFVGVALLVRTLEAPNDEAPPIPLPIALPATDPLMSAREWLRSYRQLTWTDSQPSAWVERVHPVTTGPLAQEYSVVRGAPGGAEWSEFVSHRCATSLEPQAAVVPPEAPRTPTDLFVLVSGDASTTCTRGAPPGDPVEHVSATVELVMGPDGRWRVTRRLY